MVLLLELLHVLRGGPARARLEESTTVHERNDREHLRARADLEDREEIREVVAKDVSGDRDRVFAVLDALDGELCRFDRRKDVEFEPFGIMLAEVPVDLLDKLSVMCTRGVEPEDRRRTSGPCT